MFRLIFQLIVIGLCSMLFGFAFNTFLIPHKLTSGGVTGIAFFIHHFLHINTGWIILLINIPLFLVGLKYLGKKFILLTGYAVIVLSFSMKFIPIHPISHDILLSSIIGGALYGIAVGIIIRIGGSTGGTDIVSLTLAKKKELTSWLFKYLYEFFSGGDFWADFWMGHHTLYDYHHLCVWSCR
ncbi:YitT family protein [Bacillus sp. ISL-40]|nr:YitT family protein [Bacillus sp. ISL-40]